MSDRTNTNATESLPGQSNTSTMASSIPETLPKITRKDTTVWHDVKKYLLSRAKTSRDPHFVIPRPICALCDGDEELDIAGVPATDPTSVRFEGAVLACGHMFCIPCLNEYEDNLPDPNPYDNAYNTVCGRRKLTREYRCPTCRADMHHKKCWCEVGACRLPTSAPLDGGVEKSGGQWVCEMLHPGERRHEETEAVEGVNNHHSVMDDYPALMNKETRKKLVELVLAVATTMPELEAAVASSKNDDDDDDDDEESSHDDDVHNSEAREDEDNNGSPEDDDSEDDDDGDDSPTDSNDSDEPHSCFNNILNLFAHDNRHENRAMAEYHRRTTRYLHNLPLGLFKDAAAGLNSKTVKTYPIALWNRCVKPVCDKCHWDRMERHSCLLLLPRRVVLF
ncbi:hypothetical protein QBC32DRAFT_373191 [Pseudoneurospora amorphoporcata]|uniref:RING-type domain-containing protein n=1 Tax=Pseudoneurospora amorphoporcata TaxID=241081 RepID=A0AAN6SCU4_9PEZI|nr:hypothetical protein QBC32DRAFT_373191 [Pseudoneurospora amorphoporcata]